MAEDISTLDKWVRQDRWPHVECPVCQVGALSPDFLKGTPSEETLAYYRESHDESFIKGQFHGVLKCSFAQCGERVTVAGEMEVDFDAADDGRTTHFEFYRLRYATPALSLIKPPPGTPGRVQLPIRAASSVVWVDPSAAANRLRVAVDELLTTSRVPKTRAKDGKRARLTTHQRIVAFRDAQTKVADTLLAVKWIGNAGSHESTLTVSDVLEGAQMLGYALRLLYDTTDAEIERRVRAVNRRKGPAKKAASKS